MLLSRSRIVLLYFRSKRRRFHSIMKNIEKMEPKLSVLMRLESPQLVPKTNQQLWYGIGYQQLKQIHARARSQRRTSFLNNCKSSRFLKWPGDDIVSTEKVETHAHALTLIQLTNLSKLTNLLTNSQKSHKISKSINSFIFRTRLMLFE